MSYAEVAIRASPDRLSYVLRRSCYQRFTGLPHPGSAPFRGTSTLPGRSTHPRRVLTSFTKGDPVASGIAISIDHGDSATGFPGEIPPREDGEASGDDRG